MLRLLTLALSGLLLAAATREWEAVPPCAEAEPAPAPEQQPQGAPELSPPAGQVQQAVAMPELPAAEQVAALPPETLASQRATLKNLLLNQTLRLLREEHRLTPENLTESADAAQEQGAPLFWQQAMRALASGSLSPRERHELLGRLESFYALYGVDPLAVRLFVETAGLTEAEIAGILPRLPMEALFNLPPTTPATPEDLAAQAGALREVFEALLAQFAKVDGKDSADAAADALVPYLVIFDRTQQLRLSGPQEQVRAFTEHRDFFPPAAKALHEQRLRLHNAGYFSSPRLRAVNYFLQ